MHFILRTNIVPNSFLYCCPTNYPTNSKKASSDYARGLYFLVSQARFELTTHGLEGRCSIQLSYWDNKNGAGDGNRTHVTSLEGWSSTIELHPHVER